MTNPVRLHSMCAASVNWEVSSFRTKLILSDLRANYFPLGREGTKIETERKKERNRAR